MASFTRVVMSGSTNILNVNYPYLDKSFVHVYLDGEELAANAYTWLTDSQVSITAGNPTAGTVGETRRTTPSSPLVNFQPGNLDAGDLNVSALQAIHIGEEARDRMGDISSRAWVTAGFQTGGTITKAAAGYVATFDEDGNLYGAFNAVDISQAQGYAQAAFNSAVAADGYAEQAFTYKQDAAASASAAATSASNAATSEANAAAAVGTALAGATVDDTFADSDQFVYVSGSTLKKGLLTGLISSIFNATRKIANVIVDATNFKVRNAGGFDMTFNTTALTAPRELTMPNSPVDLGLMSQLGMGQTWQAFTTTANVARQNTSGKPIGVTTFAGASSTLVVSVSVDSSTWTVVYDHSGSSSRAMVSLIVPNGYYYRTNTASGMQELR